MDPKPKSGRRSDIKAGVEVENSETSKVFKMLGTPRRTLEDFYGKSFESAVFKVLQEGFANPGSRKENVKKPAVRARFGQGDPVKVNSGTIEVIVELPRGSINNARRTFKIPSETTAGQFKGPLARKLNVANTWRLYGRRNEYERPAPISMDTPLNEFDRTVNKKAQLYLFPDIVV